MKQEGGKGNFAALKRAFRLLVDDVDDKTPTDIAYVFSGYAPLSVSAVISVAVITLAACTFSHSVGR